MLDPIYAEPKEWVFEYWAQMKIRLGADALFAWRPLEQVAKRAFGEKVYLFDQQADDLFKPDDHSSIFDVTRPIRQVYNSGQLGLIIALFLGFQHVYLIGFDHTSLFERKHFYEGPVVKSAENQSRKVTPERYSVMLFEHWRMWEKYIQISKYASSNGIEIFNATEGGLLNVFPQVTLKSVFQNL